MSIARAKNVTDSTAGCSFGCLTHASCGADFLQSSPREMIYGHGNNTWPKASCLEGCRLLASEVAQNSSACQV